MFGGFGQTAAAKPAPSFGGFGQQSTPSTGGLFGSQAQSAQPQQQPQQQQQQQQQGGLFGSGAAANGTSTAGTSGGLFGQNQNQNQSQSQQKPVGMGTGGLFGSTSAPAGGLFGSMQPQQQQQQGGGLFGSTQQTGQAGGLFGSTQQQQPQQQQQQQQPGGMFGSTLGASQFGNQQQNQAQGPIPTQQAMQQSLFGPKKEMDIEWRIKAVQNAWDSANPDCRFKFFFYNVVEEGTTGRYARPPGANDDAKWAKALRDNPEPSSMVPVLATGWNDVKKRQQLQENIAAVHQERINEITSALAHTRQTSLSSSIRLANLQARQAQLIHRLIHLAAQTPQHVPIIQSTVFKQEEAEMSRKLEGVKAALEGNGRSVPGGGRDHMTREQRGRLLGQVNELWGQLEEIRRRRKITGHDRTESWVGDEKVLGEIAEVLSNQQNALSRLSDLAQGANFDADVILQKHGGGGS